MANSGKFIDSIIDEIREETENESFSTDIGLTEEELIRYINDAIYRLHSKIVAQHSSVFIEEETQNVTQDVATYTINSTAFLDNRIALVEYSSDGDVDNYVPLSEVGVRQRYPGSKGCPVSYIRKSNQIVVVPTPSNTTGTLRISFTKRPKRMDKRRGQVKAVTLLNNAITNLEVNYVNGSAVDAKELGKFSYFTVVDKYGVIKMDNVQLSSIDTSAGYDATLTADSSFTYDTGETIAVGDYVLAGKYATTHFELAESVERYVRSYAIWKVLKRDSSVDSAEAVQELMEMESGIIASYAELTDDIRTVPDILDDGSWY